MVRDLRGRKGGKSGRDRRKKGIEGGYTPHTH